MYSFGLGPLLDMFIKLVFIDNGSEYHWNLSPGPCWFLGWLLLFNGLYLVMDASVPIYVAKLPSLTKMVLLGL